MYQFLCFTLRPLTGLLSTAASAVKTTTMESAGKAYEFFSLPVLVISAYIDLSACDIQQHTDAAASKVSEVASSTASSTGKLDGAGGLLLDVLFDLHPHNFLQLPLQTRWPPL